MRCNQDLFKGDTDSEKYCLFFNQAVTKSVFVFRFDPC